MTEPQKKAPPRVREVVRQYVDTESGVVHNLSHEEPIKGRRPARPRSAGFCMVDPAAMQTIHLSAREWQVFWSLMSRMSLENGEIRYSRQELAIELGMEGSQVNRCIREIEKEGVIRRRGVHLTYVDPKVAWRGDALQRETIEKEFHA